MCDISGMRFARGCNAPEGLAPRGTAAQDPQDRVEHLPRVTPLAAGGLRGREKIANELPLPLVEFVSSYHGSSVAAELFFVVLRQSLGVVPTCVGPLERGSDRPPPAPRATTYDFRQ